jgi:hypothetical protein
MEPTRDAAFETLVRLADEHTTRVLGRLVYPDDLYAAFLLWMLQELPPDAAKDDLRGILEWEQAPPLWAALSPPFIPNRDRVKNAVEVVKTYGHKELRDRLNAERRDDGLELESERYKGTLLRKALTELKQIVAESVSPANEEGADVLGSLRERVRVRNPHLPERLDERVTWVWEYAARLGAMTAVDEWVRSGRALPSFGAPSDGAMPDQGGAGRELFAPSAGKPNDVPVKKKRPDSDAVIRALKAVQDRLGVEFNELTFNAACEETAKVLSDGDFKSCSRPSMVARLQRDLKEVLDFDWEDTTQNRGYFGHDVSEKLATFEAVEEPETPVKNGGV